MPRGCSYLSCCLVTQSCLIPCSSMDCSIPGFPVLHRLLELAPILVHWVGDAIQPYHPLLPSSSPALNLSQHQGLFQWVGSSHHVAKSIGASASASVFPVNIQGWFPLGLTGLIFLLSKGLSRVFYSTTFWKHQFFDTQPSLCSNSPSIHDYWKDHSFDYTDLCWQSDVSIF